MFLQKHFGKSAPSTELEDILQNLMFLLKTKRGSGYFLQNFGLSDVGYRTPEEMVVTLTNEITENVRLFEPRVELLRIDEEYADDGKRSRLVITLRHRDAGEKLAIVVDLQKPSFDVVAVEGK
jgi:phage baseplate assembly protein W